MQKVLSSEHVLTTAGGVPDQLNTVHLVFLFLAKLFVTALAGFTDGADVGANGFYAITCNQGHIGKVFG